MLVKIADAYPCNKKTYNNAVSALRRAFDFGYLDYPQRRDPAASLECARIGKNDRPIAVGTSLSGRPPRRSGRAQLRHPAPTVGV